MPRIANRHLSPGARLLGAILASRWQEPETGLIAGLAAEASPAEFVDTVFFHGLISLLGHHHRECLDGVPAPLLEPLQALRRTARLRGLAALFCLRKALQALEAQGIPALPLKGHSLSWRLYGDALVRQSDDVDVLVDPSQAHAALHALKACGFTSAVVLPNDPVQLRQFMRSVHHLELRSADGIAFELHWRTDPVKLTSLPPLSQLLGELERTESGPLAGSLRLPDHRLFAFLASHACRSRCLRWKWGQDIVELVGQAYGDPWSPAVFGRLDGPVRHTLAVMGRQWGVELPRRRLPVTVRLTCVAAALEETQFRGRIAHRSLAQGAVMHAAVFAAQPSWRARAAHLSWVCLRLPNDTSPAVLATVGRLPLLAPLVRLGWALRRLLRPLLRRVPGLKRASRPPGSVP